MMICNECETVAHCSKHGCVPKRDFWEGYVPEPVKPAQCAPAEDGVCEALDCSNHKPAQQKPVAYLVDGDLYYPEEIDWETLQEQGHTVAPLYTKDQL